MDCYEAVLLHAHGGHDTYYRPGGSAPRGPADGDAAAKPGPRAGGRSRTAEPPQMRAARRIAARFNRGFHPPLPGLWDESETRSRTNPESESPLTVNIGVVSPEKGGTAGVHGPDATRLRAERVGTWRKENSPTRSYRRDGVRHPSGRGMRDLLRTRYLVRG